MKRLLRACWLAVFTCLLASCATVPDTGHGTMPRSQIRIATDSGWLSYQRSQDIVKKLDGVSAPAASGDIDAATAGFLQRHLQVEEAISGSPMTAGNRVDLLADGPSTYRAMLDAIHGARQYVHMESYIFDDDD